MRSSLLRTLAVASGGAALVAAALTSSCFQAPPFGGPYLCSAQQACPSPYSCDDGICCTPDAGGPLECPSYVMQDGRCSDGGTPRLWFQDLDQDGFGNNGTGRLVCREPVSYHASPDAGDCNDDPSDAGAAFHPGAPDGCDGKDNDCDRQIDEPPTCGGPASIFIDPGIAVGAKKLTMNWFNGSPPRCLRDDPEDIATAADVTDRFTGAWHGIGPTTHVLWAQAPAGTTWDLRAAGKSFRIFGKVQVSSANYPTDWIWYEVPQPWILLCGPAGFLRLAPVNSLLSLTYAPEITIDDTFPVRGGSGWTIEPGSATDRDAVLAQVEHVEILVELKPASGSPSFDFGFEEGFMGFR